MYYKRIDFPEEKEIVICTVTKILPNSVFVKLNEFQNLEGMIHISEISPGRIRNIRDFVKENKKIVCKVLRTDKSKNHIDLSLRRVSLTARKNKNDEMNQEVKAEKLLDGIAKKLKIKPEELYKKIALKIIERHHYLHLAFQDIVNKNYDLNDITIDTKIKNTLIKTVKERIKPPEVNLKSIIQIQSKQANCIEKIKKTLKKAQQLAEQKKYKLKILYLGSPKYEIIINSRDYKTAEKHLEDINEFIVKEIKSQKGEAEWQKKS